MLNEERPLVTFALFAYNQEKYIKDALQGAFSQTYEPLEIILSDDCSTDQTFEIMRTMADLYRGPHTVRLNRNVRNLNIGNHVNVVNELARGELVVAAAGDDISRPERASELVGEWLASGKAAGLLHSARTLITENGEVMREIGCHFLHSLETAEASEIANVNVAGATEAWDKRLFQIFGDFRGDLMYEDCALTFRSLLARRPIRYVDKPLVLYRYAVGVAAVSSGPLRHVGPQARRTLLQRLRVATQQKMDDLRVFPDAKLASILAMKASRQDVGLRFEDTWPSLSELAGMRRHAGARYVIAMMFKRLRNQWRDRQQ